MRTAPVGWLLNMRAATEPVGVQSLTMSTIEELEPTPYLGQLKHAVGCNYLYDGTDWVFDTDENRNHIELLKGNADEADYNAMADFIRLPSELGD